MDDLAEAPECIRLPSEGPETAVQYLCRIVPKGHSDVFGIEENRRGAETTLSFPAHVKPRNEKRGTYQVLRIDI